MSRTRSPQPSSDATMHSKTGQRSRTWTRLQSCLRHGDALQPATMDPRSIFFTSSLLRANGEPC